MTTRPPIWPAERPAELRSMEHEGAVAVALADGSAARSAIGASWRRSARVHGLDRSHRVARDRLTEAEFCLPCQRLGPLREAAAPTLDHLFQAVGGNASAAARATAISRATFHRKLGRKDQGPTLRRGEAEPGSKRFSGAAFVTLWNVARPESHRQPTLSWQKISPYARARQILHQRTRRVPPGSPDISSRHIRQLADPAAQASAANATS